MMKKISLLSIIIGLVVGVHGAPAAANTAAAAETITTGIECIMPVKVAESATLTTDDIESRADLYILVEIITGTCVNDAGDGVTTDGYYISYKGVPGHAAGRTYRTTCLYANNNYIDDIIVRHDLEV